MLHWLKLGFNIVAVIAALVAAIAWYAAAGYPVAKIIPAYYSVTSEDMKPFNDKVQRGATLNGRAATWAAISALFQAFGLLVDLIGPLFTPSL